MDDELFTTMRAIRDHLEGLGFEGCSVPTLYRHAQDGHLKRPPVSAAEVEEFAAKWLRRRPQGAALDDKAAAEARRLAAQADLAETRAAMLKGGLVDRGWSERQLALRAVLLRQDLSNVAHTDAPELIRLAAGDDRRTPDIVAFLLDRFELLLSRYAEDAEFQVPAPPALLGAEP